MLTIGRVARQLGVQPSAIRYYEIRAYDNAWCEGVPAQWKGSCYLSPIKMTLTFMLRSRWRIMGRANRLRLKIGPTYFLPTPDNHLRHRKFIGLREDKDSNAVVRRSLTPESIFSSVNPWLANKGLERYKGFLIAGSAVRRFATGFDWDSQGIIFAQAVSARL